MPRERKRAKTERQRIIPAAAPSVHHCRDECAAPAVRARAVCGRSQSAAVPACRGAAQSVCACTHRQIWMPPQLRRAPGVVAHRYRTRCGGAVRSLCRRAGTRAGHAIGAAAAAGAGPRLLAGRARGAGGGGDPCRRPRMRSELVEVDWEELPMVTDAEAALEPGTPVVHPNSATTVFRARGGQTGMSPRLRAGGPGGGIHHRASYRGRRWNRAASSPTTTPRRSADGVAVHADPVPAAWITTRGICGCLRRGCG